MSQRRSSDYDDFRYAFKDHDINEFPNIFDLRDDFEDSFDKDEPKRKNWKESYMVQQLEKSDLTDDELIGYLTVKQLLDNIARKV